MLRSLFGRGVRRTAEPVCGQLMQDVPGSAQGRWYMGSSDMDDRNLALVHDNVIPTLARSPWAPQSPACRRAFIGSHSTQPAA
jgi:hypothetical protein